MGVSLQKSTSKWVAQCKGRYLGYHATEEGAACACSKYLEDGSAPGPAFSSLFKGVIWSKSHNKWTAQCKGKHVGYHATEEDAARAYNKYLKDGIDPVERREVISSQFKGVYWDKKSNKWRAKHKRNYLGCHTTEEAEARAYTKYLRDDVVPGYAGSSKFKGVSWIKNKSKWKTTYKGAHLGYHTTEKAAAQAYNVEAERLGRPLNVIPPTGAAGAGAGPKHAGTGAGAGGGAGPKRVGPKTSAAPAPTEKTKRAAPTTPLAPVASLPSKKLKL